MKIQTLFIILLSTASFASAEVSTAVGWEEDVHVEAALLSDTITSGAPIGITVRIENLTSAPLAVAEKLCSAVYEVESRTVVISIGSEIPNAAAVPQLSIIPAGGKRTFTTGAKPHITDRGTGRFAKTPRFVQIKVNVLRAWNADAAKVADKLFEQWLDDNVTILLNALPVYYLAHDATDRFESAEVR